MAKKKKNILGLKFIVDRKEGGMYFFSLVTTHEVLMESKHTYPTEKDARDAIFKVKRLTNYTKVEVK